MPQTIASLKQLLGALVAALMLAAFVLPATAVAGCYEPPSGAQASMELTDRGTLTSIASTPEAHAPIKEPIEPADQSAVCQHGHCGHAQAWLSAPGMIEARSFEGSPTAAALREDFLASWLIDGPERPPQP